MKTQPQSETGAAPSMVKGSAVLPFEMRSAIDRRADETGRPRAYVLRDLVGEALGVPKANRHPAPRRKAVRR